MDIIKILYYYFKYKFQFIYYSCTIKFRKRTSVQNINTCISLTSYNKRINYRLILVLESLLNQSIKCDFVLLSLSKNDIETMPKYFTSFLARNNNIKLVETDSKFKSYNKYLPVLKHFPSYNFIVCDDDIIYPYNFVENLLNVSRKKTNCSSVVFNRFHLISKNLSNKIDLYKNWKHNQNFKNINFYCQEEIFITTGAGTLFPSNIISLSDFNWDLIESNFSTVDDVFIHKLLEIKGVNKVSSEKYFQIIELYDPFLSKLNLSTLNKISDSNDIAMRIDISTSISK